MNQMQIKPTAPLRKLKLTMAGSKPFHKNQTSISTQTTSPDQLLRPANLNGIVEKEVAQFKLSEKQQHRARFQQWSIMKEESLRLADMGMLGDGEILSSIQCGPSSGLFHQQLQFSIKGWLFPTQQVVKQNQNSQKQPSSSQDLFIHKSEAIKYRNPYSYWFSSQHNKTYSNRPNHMGLQIYTKN